MSWPNVAIDEIFEVARGGSPRPIQKFLTDDPDGINWVMISDASLSNKYITKTKQRIIPEGRKKSRDVKQGDFLLTNSMSFGRPYIMRTTGCIHDGWLLLRPRNEKVDQDFFYHLLGSSEVYARLAARAPGSTVKNLNSDIVRETLVPLPPIEQQKRIAAILDQADSLRRLRQRAIGRLNTLGHAIFYEMFLSKVEHWPEDALASLGQVITGSTPPTARQDYFKGDIPFVTPGDLEADGGVKRTLSEEGALKSRTVEAGSVLVCCIGATIGKIDQARERSAFNQQINAVQWGRSIEGDYGLFALRHIRQQIIFKGKGASTTLPILRKSEFQKLKIPVPPKDVQLKFSYRIRAVGDSRRASRNGLEGADALFSSLQHRAFRGEL